MRVTEGAYLLAAILTINPALAQSSATFAVPPPAPRVTPAPRFTSDSRIVLVPTTVMNRKGALVTGLSRDSFELTQDNLREEISSFGEEDVPVSLGIVLDVSGSMQRTLGEAKHTLRTFFEAANPEDEAFLFTVAGRPNRESGFTRNFNTLLEQAMFTDAGGSTALVDTIYAALAQMRKAQEGRKAILIISDGMDNHSRYTAPELMAAAVEADLQIYSLSVFDPPRNKKPIELGEERNGIHFLEDLTRRTGGVSLLVRDTEEATRAADRMARIMRDQYLLGYVPASADESGKWHKLKVAVHAPDAQAYARSGYYAK